MKSPKAVSLKDLPKDTEINSFEDLNSVLSFLGIQTKIESNSFLSQLKDFQEETSFLNNLDFKKLKESENKIKFLKNCEEECDKLEVAMANLRNQLIEYKRLNKINSKDLEGEIANYNKNFNDIQFETINSEVLNSIFSFIRGELVDENVINAFSYVKEIEGFDLLLRKYEILEEIGGGFCDLLTKGETVRVEDFCIAMGGDRIGALELLYTLQSADVISFDSARGLIKLKK